ncbi:MAG: septal ring lytic transglycosylase RlpA family protein [Solirubrobacteraceae bacterium]
MTVVASGSGITLHTRASTMLRRAMRLFGTAPRSMAGETVQIERLGHETDWTWTATVSATIRSDGSFHALWHTNHIGAFQIRAVVGGPTASTAPTTASTGSAGPFQPAVTPSGAATPALSTTVYRRSFATQYGPGFYGRRTACGQRLHRDTIGLANKKLRCGTMVALYFRGRTLSVPVIDRGPYANGADWDLTTATAQALGIDGSAAIGAVSLPAPPASPPS